MHKALYGSGTAIFESGTFAGAVLGEYGLIGTWLESRVDAQTCDNGVAQKYMIRGVTFS